MAKSFDGNQHVANVVMRIFLAFLISLAVPFNYSTPEVDSMAPDNSKNLDNIMGIWGVGGRGV
jgi:hypothetical protein